LPGVPEKIDAAASTPAATRKKRPRANAARAKIAGRDLIDAPPLNRVALSRTASDERIVGAFDKYYQFALCPYERGYFSNSESFVVI